MTQSKAELRNFAKNSRNKLNMKDVSEKILKIFLASLFYKNSKNIAAYYPIGSEVNLVPMFNDKTKSFFLPKILDENNTMNFVKYEGNLVNNKYNIPEPTGTAIDPTVIDTILLPALMADKQGYRLGYGGGYYDRFLAENNICAIKIILIPEYLLVDKLPVEVFDISANIIITEKRLIKIQ